MGLPLQINAANLSPRSHCPMTWCPVERAVDFRGALSGVMRKPLQILPIRLADRVTLINREAESLSSGAAIQRRQFPGGNPVTSRQASWSGLLLRNFLALSARL
jgi:hypothetical protein